MGTVVLYAEFTARAGYELEAEALISAYADLVRAEPGNLGFDVYTRDEASARFVVFEAYRDQTAFEAHLAGADGVAFNAALTPLIEEPASDLSFLRPLDVAGWSWMEASEQ
jgi:quinol monooxygenase YgiN